MCCLKFTNFFGVEPDNLYRGLMGDVIILVLKIGLLYNKGTRSSVKFFKRRRA